ncbi:putative spermidine/putrescine transport system substrate-binding protein [Devosia sp. UYZn731]|uniref:ABC transporter substrate-binding protein n=1 Tax=Devosia sp. UYZn731 TaxID=3156345 RepID=UPI0033966CBD
MNISRRTSLVLGAGLALSTLTRTTFAQEKGTVRMLIWDGYAEQEWIDEFTAQTGYKVEATYATSADEQIAKMKASGGKDYDLVAVDSASIKTFVDQKLITPLDLARLPSFDNVLPDFKTVQAPVFDGIRYGIPLAWGSLGLVYDKKEFPNGPDSWGVMWDPKYKGRVLSQDDANNNINLGAIMIGLKDPFNVQQDEFPKVATKLADLRENLLSYFAGFDEGTTLFAENDVVLMFSMGEPSAIALTKKGFDVGYAIPKEGALGWMDNLTVSAGAENVDGAYAWMNFFLQARIGAAMTNKFGYGSTTSAENAPNYTSRLIWAKPPEDLAMRQKVWNEVRSGAN